MGTNKVCKAIDFANKKHKGQKDDSGKNYFTAHICQVANIIKFISDDTDLNVAAYLHDTLEDTNTTYKELLKEFGLEVADLVMEVTHKGNKKNGYYFPRLKSKKAIILKFADRLSNISRMETWDRKRQEQYLNKSKFWRVSK